MGGWVGTSQRKKDDLPLLKAFEVENGALIIHVSGDRQAVGERHLQL